MVSTQQNDKNCTIYIQQNDLILSSSEIQTQLKEGKIEDKINALKALIINIIHDPSYPQLIMPVISHIVPIEETNHKLKCVLHYYWEVISKIDKQGKMIDTILLACNSIRRDLQSPNEYIRGRTLRMVSRLMFRTILEPLIQVILECIKHKNVYVRRNAIQCLYNIQLHFGDELFSDIEGDIMKLLLTETDLSTKRNSFLLLFQLSQEKAMEYLNKQIENDSLQELGDILQISILDLFRKVAKYDNTMKSQLLKAVFQFRDTRNEGVKMECAHTLLQIATTPKTLQMATEIYISLLISTSYNNLKLVILQKFELIYKINQKYLVNYVSDIVKILSSKSFEISKQCLNLIIPLASPQNIDSIIHSIQTEIRSMCQDKQSEMNDFKYLLLKTLNSFVIKYPKFSKEIFYIVSDNFLCTENPEAENCTQIKQIFIKLCQRTENRELVCNVLLEKMENIKDSQIFKILFQIVGSYSSRENTVKAIKCILKAVGPMPLTKKEEKIEDKESKQVKYKSVVLADGTYGNVAIDDEVEHTESCNINLRNQLIEEGFLGCVFTRSLVLLAYNLKDEIQQYNQNVSQILLVVCSLLRIYMSSKIDMESVNQLNFYLKNLISPKQFLESENDWLRDDEESVFQTQNEIVDQEKNILKQPDDTIVFRGLNQQNNLFDEDLIEDEIIVQNKPIETSDYVKKLDMLVQLTGYSDPIYSETFMQVEKYQINFEVLLVNRSQQLLQKIYIQFFQGKNIQNQFIRKAESVTLKPNESKIVTLSMKFDVTQGNVIFGSIDYENRAGIEQQYLITEEIMVDLVDYIVPASTDSQTFINNWAKYGWENRITVNTQQKDMKKYISAIQKHFKLTLIDQDINKILSNYVSINLYAKTTLEDDFLVNISIEQDKITQKLTGYIRIRSRMKGLVSNLGSKLKELQSKI